MNSFNDSSKPLKWLAFAALAAAFAIFAYPKFFSNQDKIMEKIHVLKHPLLLGSEDNAGYHLIPAGTTLYYEHSMPEGFSTYRIYINVEGGRLPLEENKPTHSIKPASAFSIDKNQLLSLLRDVELRPNDLEAILNNGNFSLEEKKEIHDLLKKTK